MIKKALSIDIDRPVEEVFAFVADAGNDGHWRTEVVRSVLVAGETGRPGARHRQVMRQGKRESESTHETVDIEPGRKVHWKTPDDEGPLTFSGYWGCEPLEGGGTRFTIYTEVRPHGSFKLMQPIMKPYLTRVSRRYATALKRHLEQNA